VVLSHLERIKKENEKRVQNGLEKQIVGVLGCMAERVRDNFPKGYTNIVAGPDSYKSLPFLIADIKAGNEKAFNVELSNDETYSDILPSPSSNNEYSKFSNFVSITRGCNNMCTFCIVPFVRGRERSKTVQSILDEVQKMTTEQNCKEITLLGQNVNSYRDLAAEPKLTISGARSADGFTTVYQENLKGSDFGELLSQLSQNNPETLFRFTSPHPKDFNDNCLYAIKNNKNISRWLHFPLQSGSSEILKHMRRGYSREAYNNLFYRIKDVLDDDGRDDRSVYFSTDIITGFCHEEEIDHEMTLNALEEYRFSQVFQFAYSERPGSPASRNLPDNVPEIVKKRRLNEIVPLTNRISAEIAAGEVGKIKLVLATRLSDKKGDKKQGQKTGKTVYGFTDGGHKVNLQDSESEKVEIGKFFKVLITGSKNRILSGKVLGKSSIGEFY